MPVFQMDCSKTPYDNTRNASRLNPSSSRPNSSASDVWRTVSDIIMALSIRGSKRQNRWQRERSHLTTCCPCVFPSRKNTLSIRNGIRGWSKRLRITGLFSGWLIYSITIESLMRLRCFTRNAWSCLRISMQSIKKLPIFIALSSIRMTRPQYGLTNAFPLTPRTITLVWSRHYAWSWLMRE